MEASFSAPSGPLRLREVGKPESGVVAPERRSRLLLDAESGLRTLDGGLSVLVGRAVEPRAGEGVLRLDPLLPALSVLLRRGVLRPPLAFCAEDAAGFFTARIGVVTREDG